MSSTRLTETSYIVLGLLEQFQPATPYDLKRLAEISTINFWSVPHTQLYTECARLAQAGLLSEQREQTGRRRRIYRVTERGAQALAEWRSEPTDALEEVRDAGLLKLFFGADPAKLAATQLQAHRHQLEAYEQMHAETAELPRGMRLALEAGIGHEREFVRFWSELDESARRARVPVSESAPAVLLSGTGPPREDARAPRRPVHPPR
jgi:DNA-binding PadR family transcriptional regulator